MVRACARFEPALASPKRLFNPNGRILYFGVPVFVFITLVATAVSITFELEGAIESLIISAGLLSSTFVDGGRVTLPRTFAAWTYVTLAFLVQQLRLLLALVMVEQTIQIVGTSDGPLNILLNATALMFLLGLDSGFGIGATRSAVPETISGTPRRAKTFSSSVTSKSIRLIFGRIVFSRQILSRQRKIYVETVRICSH